MSNTTGREYVAKQGDTWDLISFKVFAEERMAGAVMAANPDLARILIFEGGERVWIPEVSSVYSLETLPPWRR